MRESKKNMLLMMLKDFAVICERHDLCWFVAYGTALGAVRDKGFIPWDDDLDICMPREDLDTFVQIIQEDTFGRYSIMNSQVNANYPMATTRLMLDGTEFRDVALQTVDFKSCIFLDLFPLDNLADNEKSFRKQAWRAWLYNKLSIARSVRSPYISGGGARSLILRAGTFGMRNLLKLPGLRTLDFNKHSLQEQTRYNGAQTQRVGFLCETDRLSCVYDRTDLFPVRMVVFEDMEVPIAC
ncbi:MAG: LicD family protein, partial [Raoultibacter sp.]